MAGSQISCNSKGEISVAEILAFINKLSSGSGYTKPEADARFVKKAGDKMTGHLYMTGAAKINLQGQVWVEGKSGKMYAGGQEILNAVTGLKKTEPGDVWLKSKQATYLISNSNGLFLNYQNRKQPVSIEGSKMTFNGHTVWHAGNSKGIRTRLVGNTLYMTDNQTNA